MNNYYAYGIHRTQWKSIKDEVVSGWVKSHIIAEKYNLDKIQIWFLYDKLLRGEQNDLYVRGDLLPEDIKVGQFVYCDYPDFGRGEIVADFKRDEFPSAAHLMDVKFENRKYPTMCSAETMITVHDGTKRKITKL